jgi:hypothetical protein
VSDMAEGLCYIAIGFILIGLGLNVGCACGKAVENDDWKEWCVDTGRAEFYLNDKHEKVWRWKEQP